jgi:hypothetical protein
MIRINASFKKVNEEERSSFKDSHCLLTISVGQQSHEDERFKATARLIAESFGACTITLHDTLQRHTAALSSSEEPSFYIDILKKEGDLWLDRNKEAFELFDFPPKVIRWSEWLNMDSYSVKRKLILDEIERSQSYAELFNKSFEEYLSRYVKRLAEPEKFNFKRAESLCLDYLVEECAVLCLFPEAECEYELYAGTHNEAMKETWKRFICPNYPNKVKSVKIGFNHRGDMRPQEFGSGDVR